MATFQDRLTTLDQQLEKYTQEKTTTPREQDTAETRARQLEALEAIEEEQQQLLHDLGIELYSSQEIANGIITVDLDHQEALGELEASGEQAEDLRQIRQQQVQLMQEQKQALGF